MKLWKVCARHSPCVLKRAEVKAADEDAALQAFVEENLQVARERHTKNAKIVVSAIERWASSGGLDTVEILDLGDLPGEVASTPVVQAIVAAPQPEPEPVQPKRKYKPQGKKRAEEPAEEDEPYRATVV